MKKKNLIAAATAFVLLFASIAGCAPEEQEIQKNPTGLVGPVTQTEEHRVSTGLHKIRITPRDLALVAGRKTDYTIVIPADATERTARAASLFRSHMAAATGANFRVEEENGFTYSADKHYVVIGCERLFTQAGLTMPEDYIGETGYYIVTKDNSLFIEAGADYGLQNGALRALSALVGYEMYSADTVVYKDGGDDIMLPEIEIIERPDFEFGLSSNGITSDGIIGMRFMNTPDVFIPVDSLYWHNTFAYLPKGLYEADHPGWYSVDGKQLCYTARGDSAEYEAMIEAAAQKLIATVDSVTRANNITFTIQDTTTFCTCEACAAENEKYGTDSAVVVKFCNRLSEKLDAHLEALSKQNGTPLRNVNLLFFAYNKTTKPPVKKVNGKYEPIDESVVCRKNVGVYIAPISAVYTKSFYDEANRETAEVIEGWGVCSEKLYMWLYETNYSHYLYPLCSYDTMLETFRFCKENNAIFMFPEGQWNQSNVTCFGKFKEYFDSKAEWDVNIDYAALVDDFFANYFREAAAPMRKYFDEMQSHFFSLATEYPAEVNGNIYNNMAQARFWPKRLLDQWAGYIDEAYAAIAPYAATDPALYETLVKHIRLESLFIRFAQVTLQAGSYSLEELTAMRRSFREDCAELSVTMRSETESLENTFSGWND